MNNIIFSGRLTADPEIRYSTGAKQTCIATINVAVDRDFKREGEASADFFKCICFGKAAENIEKYLTKGTKIIGQGSLQNNNYEKDGVKHYGMQIVLSKWEFAESKKSASENEAAPREKDEFMPINPNVDIDMPFA